MTVLNYVKTQINKLNKFSLDVFGSFFSDIKHLRKKSKTIDNNVGTHTYDIKDVYNIVINSCSDNTTIRDSINKDSSFNDTYLSTVNYWLSKVYKLSTFDDQYYKIYQFSESIRKSLFIHKNNPLRRIYNKYNVFAGDGTVSECSFKNSYGKNVASYTTSIIFNTSTKMVYDYHVMFNNNELTGILNAKLTKADIIVLDRGYSKLSFMDKLSNRTNFIIRLTKNLLIYKKFMKTNKNSMIIKRNGYDIKLIKYSVDGRTRRIIKNRYIDCDNNEDNDSIFVIVTNLIDLTFNEICELYKKRWSVEVCNKNIKSNFNMRHIVKQYNSSDPITKISFYVSLSIFLYNVTMFEKTLLEMKYYYEHQKHVEYNYSQHVDTYKQIIIDTINSCDKKILLSTKHKEHRLKVNKRYPKKKKCIINNKKRGRYKSLEKLAKLNDRDDIIIQIKKYYKKVKGLNKLRQLT